MFYSSDKLHGNSFKVDASNKDLDNQDPIWLNDMAGHLLTVWAILFLIIFSIILILISGY